MKITKFYVFFQARSIRIIKNIMQVMKSVDSYSEYTNNLRDFAVEIKERLPLNLKGYTFDKLILKVIEFSRHVFISK